jgi:hypothetical protein
MRYNGHIAETNSTEEYTEILVFQMNLNFIELN